MKTSLLGPVPAMPRNTPNRRRSLRLSAVKTLPSTSVSHCRLPWLVQEAPRGKTAGKEDGRAARGATDPSDESIAWLSFKTTCSELGFGLSDAQSQVETKLYDEIPNSAPPGCL